MKKEEVFINLKKCTEEQRKSLPQILEKAGENIYEETLDDLLNGRFDDKYIYLALFYDGEWLRFGDTLNRTELTYDQFIKLFEGGERESDGWIKVTESLPNRNDVVLVLTDYGKMDVCRFKEKDYWLNDMRPQHSNGGVVAWIPLPEPPKF